MLARNGVNVVFLFVCAAMAGCATSRSEVKLTSPVVAPSGTVVSNGRTAVIQSVIDERVFKEAPPNPGTPSLGFGGANQAPAEIKARAIGRKRNGYGKAMGDVLLENGQTVEGVVRENLTAALEEAGFQVKDEEAAGASPLLINVHIKRFWAWFEPGFWSITLKTNIVTDLDLSGAKSPTSINVRAEESRQIATEDAWMEIVDKALADYRAKVVASARKFP